MTSSSRRKHRTTAWSATGADRTWRAAAAVGLLLAATAGPAAAVRAADDTAAEPAASEPPAGVILVDGGVSQAVGGVPDAEAVRVAPEPEAFPAPDPDETIPLAEPPRHPPGPVRLTAAARAPLVLSGVVTQGRKADTQPEDQPLQIDARENERGAARGSAVRAEDVRAENVRAEEDERRDRSRQRDRDKDSDQNREKEKDKEKDKEASQGACGEESKDCRKALRDLRADDIATIGLDIRVSGRPGSDYPCECRLDGEKFQPRRFATTMFTWKAAGYCHKPLYFEDWNLERYGHSHGKLADPFFSAAHFFVTLPVLPYKMGVELPWECIYPLGYYRPGNCAPWTVPAVPISARGLAVEAATVTGVVFLLP